MSRWRSFLEEVRVDWGTDCGSDYFLLIAKMQWKFKILNQAKKQMIFTSLSWRLLIQYTGIKWKYVTGLHFWNKQIGQTNHISSNFWKTVFNKFYLVHFITPWPEWYWGKIVKLQRYWTYCCRLNDLLTRPWGTFKKQWMSNQTLTLINKDKSQNRTRSGGLWWHDSKTWKMV